MGGLTQRIVRDLLVARKASQEQDDANFLFVVVEPAAAKDEPAKGGPAVVKGGPGYQCRWPYPGTMPIIVGGGIGGGELGDCRSPL